MKLTSSYKVQIVNHNNIFKDTVSIYRKALSYLIDVINVEWGSISPIYEDPKTRKSALLFVENLVITKKGSTAKYDFQSKFYKFPSYLRRACINFALGSVSSYKSNLSNWEINPVGNAPTLQPDRYVMPCFYNDNMYKASNQANKVFVKLYIKHDWIWKEISLRYQDLKYIDKYMSQCTKSAPTLERSHKKYYLRFAFTEQVSLNTVPIENRKILAIDLGINTDATCSVMQSDGTVLFRKFINFKSEKDHLYHGLNKVRRKQREHGSKNLGNLWSYVKNYNIQRAYKISQAIIDLAKEQGCHVIVFEHLNFKGTRSRNKMIPMWRKNSIQQAVTHKAHKHGIHVSTVCARNTSKLAFDGSGEVMRSSGNYALATFSNGKQYNCDLNASYNIGSRYFIRELIKPFSEKKKSLILAKVPVCEIRTNCVLSDLINLNVELKNLCF